MDGLRVKEREGLLAPGATTPDDPFKSFSFCEISRGNHYPVTSVWYRL